MASALFIVTQCIYQVAQENRSKASPLTENSLMQNMYVDDLLLSIDAIEEVRILYHESKELFADSGFELTKWLTNANEAYSDIPEVDCLSTVHIVQGHTASLTTQEAMGLWWNLLKDCLSLDKKIGKPVVSTR